MHQVIGREFILSGIEPTPAELAAMSPSAMGPGPLGMAETSPIASAPAASAMVIAKAMSGQANDYEL